MSGQVSEESHRKGPEVSFDDAAIAVTLETGTLTAARVYSLKVRLEQNSFEMADNGKD